MLWHKAVRREIPSAALDLSPDSPYRLPTSSNPTGQRSVNALRGSLFVLEIQTL
jgi:hypothetical protein